MSKKTSFIYLLIIAAMVVVDQSIKIKIMKNFAIGQSEPMIDGFFSLTYVQNTGAAFGILKDKREVFLILSAVIIVALFVMLGKYQNPITKACLSLIIAGAIGNMIDRIKYGFVVDMFDFHGIWKYVFNFADVCVVVGICIFSLLVFLGKDN